MTHAVFDLRRELPEGLPVAHGHEDRIVTEAPLTPDLCCQNPFDRPIKDRKRPASLGHGQDATKTRTPHLVRKPFHFLENQCRVGLIGAARASIARRVDAGFPPEGIDLKSRIISQDNSLRMQGDPLSLEAGVLLEGNTGFLDFRQMG